MNQTRPYYHLVFLTLLCHLPFLINQGTFWDSWIYTYLLETNQKDLFIQQWAWNGRPLIGHLYWALGSIDTMWGFKIPILTSMIASTCLLYHMLTHHFKITHQHSLFIALFFMLYPAHQTNIAFTISIFDLAMPFFLAGIVCALNKKKYLSHLFLIISYVSEALIIPGFLVIFILWLAEKKHWKKHLRKNIDYLIIPILALLCMMYAMPTSENYAASRNLLLDVPALFNRFFLYWGSSFDFNIINPWQNFTGYNNLIFVLLGIFYVFYRGKKMPAIKITQKEFFVFFILWSATIAPFLIAGRRPKVEGWEMRYLMFAAIPAGLFLWSYIKFWGSKINTQKTMNIILMLMTLSLWHDYFTWQARWAEDKAIISLWKKDTQTKQADLIYIKDQRDRIFKETYRPYEWMMILQKSYNNIHRLVMISDQLSFDEIIAQQTLYKENYGISTSNVSENSCTQQIVIKRTPRQTPLWITGLEDIARPILTPSSYQDWLQTLISTENHIIKNCKKSIAQSKDPA